MSNPTARAGRLLLFLEDFTREPTANPDVEQLRLQLLVKNPVGSPGDAEWLPPAEVRDDLGRISEIQADDHWAHPLQPGEENVTRPRFEVGVDAMDLTLVLGPGTDEEVQLQLVDQT